MVTPSPAVWHLYLIECADGSLYTGIATDVERRFREHLSGKGARYTRSHKPVRLVASHPVGTRSQALRAELAIKRLPKGEKHLALRSPALFEQSCIEATPISMSHAKSREVVLSVKVTHDIVKGLDALRNDWRQDPHSIPKGLSCSESKAGQFVLIAAESAFTTIPGACVIKGIGALELVGSEPLFEEGASSKTLVLRDAPEGWRFSVKYVPPIVRERNLR